MLSRPEARLPSPCLHELVKALERLPPGLADLEIGQEGGPQILLQRRQGRAGPEGSYQIEPETPFGG